MTIKIIFIPSKLHHYNPTNFTTFITICLLLLSSPLPKFTNAQDGYPTEDRVTKSKWTNKNPPPHPMTGVIFIIFTGVIILVMILYYYFREACILRSAQVSRSAAAGIRFSLRNPSQQRPRGLDPEIIKTFPVFTYSEVKDLKEVMKKGQLECAVCLSVFEDDEKLRLLPKCDHVFHPQCVDVWFESHSTCPYCRADLVPEVDKSNHHVSVIVAEYENGRGGGSGGCGCSCSCGGGSDDVVLRMEEGFAGGGGSSAGGGGSSGDGTRRSAAVGVAKGDGSITTDRANNNTSSNDSNRSIIDQFRRFGGSFRKLRRWNSTGHMNSERFTLRLPTDQLRLSSGAGGAIKQDDKVVAVPLNRTRSCIVLQSSSS